MGVVNLKCQVNYRWFDYNLKDMLVNLDHVMYIEHPEFLKDFETENIISSGYCLIMSNGDRIYVEENPFENS